MIYLDTHAFVWLYAGEIGRFSASAQELLEKEEIRVSPIVLLETRYLFEIDRISEQPAVIFQYLSAHLGLKQCGAPFGNVVNFSLNEVWTRDPFNRLIVAQARLQEARLLSRDEAVQKNYSKALC